MSAREPLWITKQGLIQLHDRSIALHGGIEGLRDEGLLEAALARPKNRFAYEAIENLPGLAATYAVAIWANHPFADGNKRAALLAAGLFLRKNGLKLTASQADAALTIIALAAGRIEEEELSRWVANHSEPL